MVERRFINYKKMFDNAPKWTYQDLLEYTKLDKEKGCFIWQKRCEKGYGFLEVAKYRWRAHRFAYTLVHGEPAKHQQVQHLCNVPKCINVEHLVLGSARQNADYRLQCKRTAVGTRQPGAKLKEKDVVKIRQIMETEDYADDVLALVYGVSRRTIRAIRKNEKWNYIDWILGEE